jgi:hypothetical protein
MDINKARTVLTQMQACFMESNLQIVTESENLNQQRASDHLILRSYVAGVDCLPQILAFLWPSSEVIQFSMLFPEELAEAKFIEALAVMNDINLSSAGSYWTAIPGFSKIEFRTAYLISGDQLNKEQFKSVLKKFLDQGLEQYSNLKKLTENPGKLVN